MSSSEVLWEEVVHPGATWSHVLKRNTALRITDTEGGANVGALFYNAEFPAERLNIPDTLKAQHIGRLTAPYVLYSDMGRILCSITGDSIGWHDPLGGCSNATLVKSKYGVSDYQEALNDYHRNAKDAFLLEIAKYGLTARDLCPNINFFSKLMVDDKGAISFAPNHSKAGGFIELRAEMNVLTVLNTCQHPSDPNPKYAPKPVTLTLKRVPPAAADDPCRVVRPENWRGFTLTERYFL